MSARTAKPPPATRALEELAQTLIAYAVEWGRPELAQRIDLARRRAPSRTPTVVVVGEAKRGKSSVVNALLGLGEISPQDDVVATRAYVVFSHAEVRGAVVRDDAGRPTPIELDKLAAFVTSDPSGRGTNGIEVGLDSPLLREGLRIVDTPGVGGLDPRHSGVTKAALGFADAILFVVDAEAPISRPELDFMRDATSEASTVIVALTRIDRLTSAGASLEGTRRRLAEDIPWLAGAPVLGVCNPDKEEADELRLAGHAARADQLEHESGIPKLVEKLRDRVIRPSADLPRRNLIGVCHSVLAELRAAEQLRRDASREELDAAVAEIDAEGKRFEEAAIDAPQRLARARNTLERSFETSYDEGIQQIQRVCTTFIAELDPEFDADPPAELERRLKALRLVLARTAEQRVLALARDAFDALGITVRDRDADPLVDGDGAPTSRIVEAPLPTGADGQQTTLERVRMYALLGMSGFGVLGALGMGPLGIPLGLAVAQRLLNTQDDRSRSRERRGQLREFLGAALAEARLTVKAPLRERLDEVLSALQDDHTEGIRRRRAELKERHEAAKADRTSAGRDKGAATTRINDLRKVQRELEAL